jgi:hypothetical protein
VVTRLTSGRATGKLDASFDALIDRAARELDTVKASKGGVRGDARQAVLERLRALDAELLRTARASLDENTIDALLREADAELDSYRDRMAPDVFGRARDAAFDRLLRDRCGLPIVDFGAL